MSHAVRSFFAVPIANSIKVKVVKVMRILRARPNGDRVRWVRPDNLHVTLRFLGEVSSSELPDLVATVESEIASQTRFVCRLQELRVFPNTKHPKVLAVGLEAEGCLIELAAAIERGVRRAGMSVDSQGFRAHLTLGRMKGHGFPSIHDELQLQHLNLPVDRVVLFKSDLQPDGAVYSELESLALPEGVQAEQG